MIMGKGSQVFEGLAKLTGLPIIPLFGKGTVKIQPVHVEDVVKGIRQIDKESRYQNEILEIGGPETISLKDFLVKIAHKPIRIDDPSLVTRDILYASFSFQQKDHDRLYNYLRLLAKDEELPSRAFRKEEHSGNFNVCFYLSVHFCLPKNEPQKAADHSPLR